jgi:fructoselysine-6-P-deglycase FrlB-like protein
MTFAMEEISTQPECWSAAAELLPRAAEDLPRPGERVAVVGCGTSYNVAQAYAALREGSGLGHTDAMPASELLTHRHYDRFLFLSRSGTTTEVLDALAQIRSATATMATPTTAITADASSPIVDAAGAAIVLGFADERSVLQTRYASSALMLLRAHLGEDVRPLVVQATGAVRAPLPDRALESSRFVFLGHGWTVGIAHEGALKLREAAQAWTESYPGNEFRHGPIAVTDADTLVWSLGPLPVGLADDLVPTDATVVQSGHDPLVDLIVVQRLAVELALQRGLDPDNPRFLSRSVILS